MHACNAIKGYYSFASDQDQEEEGDNNMCHNNQNHWITSSLSLSRSNINNMLIAQKMIQQLVTHAKTNNKQENQFNM